MAKRKSKKQERKFPKRYIILILGIVLLLIGAFSQSLKYVGIFCGIVLIFLFFLLKRNDNLRETRIIRVKKLLKEGNSQENKKHGVPALFSFLIPGLGQIIKGDIFKGIAIFLGSIIGLILIFPGIIIWLWGIYDAYNSNNLF